MKQALLQLLNDFLSAILFFGRIRQSRAASLPPPSPSGWTKRKLARLRLTRRRIEPMQWMSLALVVVLGGATTADAEPPLYNKVGHRSHCRRRSDVTARVDDPVFARNRVVERARTYDRGRRLCLDRLARGARARQSVRRSALRLRHLGVVHFGRFGWRRARRVCPTIWRLPRD